MPKRSRMPHSRQLPHLPCTLLSPLPLAHLERTPQGHELKVRARGHGRWSKPQLEIRAHTSPALDRARDGRGEGEGGGRGGRERGEGEGGGRGGRERGEARGGKGRGEGGDEMKRW
jgi:hypothetical protein